jgi:hypothetical protein
MTNAINGARGANGFAHNVQTDKPLQLRGCCIKTLQTVASDGSPLAAYVGATLLRNDQITMNWSVRELNNAKLSQQTVRVGGRTLMQVIQAHASDHQGVDYSDSKVFWARLAGQQAAAPRPLGHSSASSFTPAARPGAPQPRPVGHSGASSFTPAPRR